MNSSVTRILLEMQQGRDSSDNDLETPVYEELRALATQFLAEERVGHTLQPTALVHEAYLSLVKGAEVDWSGRAHFRAVAANCMRRLLVDHARRRSAARRGGGAARVTLGANHVDDGARSVDLIELEDSLAALAKVSPRAARIAELSSFGGLTQEEVAAVMGLSSRTIRREWVTARAWLLRELS